MDDPVNRHDASGLAWDESKHPRDAVGQFTNAVGSATGYSTSGQELRASVSREVMHRANIGRNAMSEREELKRSAISRNGMMRREEILPNDKPLPKWDLDAAIAHLQTQSHKDSTGDCGTYVRQAIEAGGLRMNTSLNSSPKYGACGFGPILRDVGFRLSLIHI